MRKVTIVALVALLAVLGLAVLAGCGTTATTTTTSTTPTTAGPTTTSTGANGAAITPLNPPVEVNVAFDDAPGTAALILGDKMGFFKDVGITVKYTKFNSGADMYTALANGKVDVGRGILTASLFNGAAQGIPVWVVADAGQNIPNKNYFGIVVRKDLADQIKDYKDLKGRTILIASIGSINELFMTKALEKGGLTKNDVNEKVIDSFPDLNTALGNNAADVAVQIEPLIYTGTKDGILVPFPKDAVDYAPGEEIAPLFYSDAFKKKADVAQAFMVAYLQGARVYNDAIVQGTKDQQQVIDVLTKATFVSDPTTWVKMNPTGINPDGKVDADAVNADQQFYAGEGLVKTTVTMDQVVDPSFASKAVEILGAYQPPSQ